MNIKKFVVGPFQTNCYVLTKNQNAIVIDPAESFRRIDEYLTENQFHLSAILLTHGHFDHIGAVDKLVKKYRCPVYLCEDDEKMARHPEYNNLAGFQASISVAIEYLQKEHYQIDDFAIEVLYTPGHTNGSVMFIIEQCLFSGDTLFHNSVGRTDLYSGSESKLYQSLQMVKQLDENLLVYPGHDCITTLKMELMNNPFLQD